MATLQKNGREIARFEQLKQTYSVRESGAVLVNAGHGWKRATLKPGVTAKQFIETMESAEANRKINRPAFCAYRKAILGEFPLSMRWKFFALIDIMPDDLDGVWAELNDDGHMIDIDTLAEIRDLKAASAAEYGALKGVNK